MSAFYNTLIGQRKPIMLASYNSYNLSRSKSVYRLIKENEASSSSHNRVSDVDFNWCKFWKLKGIAPRVMFFLWRALTKSLPVNEETAKRAEKADPCCRICLEKPESIDHVLLHCPVVKMVWFASPLGLHNDFDNLTVLSLFRELLDKSEMDAFKLACFVIWGIWKERCNTQFRSSDFNIQSVVRKAKQMHDEYNGKTTSELEIPQEVPQQQEMSVASWQAPDRGWTSICLDGAYKDFMMASGVVMRDSSGQFIAGRCKFFDFGSPLEAEAKALELALEWKEDWNSCPTCIESDSQALVNCITGGSKVNWRIKGIVAKAKASLTSFPDSLKIQHIPRSKNKVAHEIARHALEHRADVVWSPEDQPPFIARLLNEDVALTFN